jgi:prepilin-type N-terminal cleavage/methylation domain-containing protein
MQQKLQQRKSEGFTIIEVMIVLAIAGLIMLIVFLAVPALQRNSRNTQYKSDAAAYAAAVNEWEQNNDGKVPAVAADLTNTSTGVNVLAKLKSLTAPTAITTGPQTTVVPVGTMQLNVSVKCSTTTVGDTVTATTRAAAVRYSAEGSGSNTSKQCIEV